MLDDQLLTDVHFIVGGKKFGAHLAVLSAWKCDGISPARIERQRIEFLQLVIDCVSPTSENVGSRFLCKVQRNMTGGCWLKVNQVKRRVIGHCICMEQASNDVTQLVTDVNICCDDCYYTIPCRVCWSKSFGAIIKSGGRHSRYQTRKR